MDCCETPLFSRAANFTRAVPAHAVRLIILSPRITASGWKAHLNPRQPAGKDRVRAGMLSSTGGTASTDCSPPPSQSPYLRQHHPCSYSFIEAVRMAAAGQQQNVVEVLVSLEG